MTAQHIRRNDREAYCEAPHHGEGADLDAVKRNFSKGEGAWCRKCLYVAKLWEPHD